MNSLALLFRIMYKETMANNNTPAAENNEVSWEERTMARMLAAAKRSGFFAQVIDDAKAFEADGYCWVVALKLACNYWCSAIPGDFN